MTTSCHLKAGDVQTNRAINFDAIKYFSARDDAIGLDNKVFTKIGKGTLSRPVQFQEGLFVLNSWERDKDDYVLYDKNSGVLSYDPDGSGSKIPIEFAQLNKGTILIYQDLFVV
jgi:Ca2+-binding RTX toxin-like protein